MTPEQSTERRRVLVALDPCAVDPADFEASAQLAAGLGAELVALFVEDSDLIAAADLPVTHLVPAGCRELAALDAAAMRRAFRAAEARARAQLSSVAQRWRLTHSFQVTEVRQAGETLARLTRQDVLTLTGAGGQRAALTRRAAAVRAERAPCPVMLLRRDSRRGQPVAVLYEGDGDNEDGLRLGRDLAAAYGSPLLLLATGEAAEAEAASWLAETGTAGRIERIAAWEATDLARRLCELDAGLAVIDRRAAIGGSLDLDDLAEATRASLVVLGSA